MVEAGTLFPYLKKNSRTSKPVEREVMNRSSRKK
jgi:hypothetical protein